MYDRDELRAIQDVVIEIAESQGITDEWTIISHRDAADISLGDLKTTLYLAHKAYFCDMIQKNGRQVPTI